MRKLLFIFFLIPSICKAQLGVTPGVLFVRNSTDTGLLVTYPGSLGAYSLRKLTTAYAGSAIKVRRSSDNAESDIGFLVSNYLDTATMKTFVGANDGFVTTWYDQSGNSNNATQSTTANQPRIMAAGVVERVNSKPAVSFGDETDGWGVVIPTGFLNGSTSLGYFQVAQVTDYLLSNAGVFGPSTTNSTGIQVLQVSVILRPTYLSFNAGSARNDNSGAAYQLWNDATQSLTSIHGNVTDVTVYKNGSAITLTDGSAMPTLNFNGVYAIGYYNSTTNDMNGFINELIIYATNQTANRTGIEANINGFYSIF